MLVFMYFYFRVILHLQLVVKGQQKKEYFGGKRTIFSQGRHIPDEDKVNIFFRWKERFFILNEDYLQCFKKDTSDVSDMGTFIFKVIIEFPINLN